MILNRKKEKLFLLTYVMILDVYFQINVNEDHHSHNAEKNKEKKKSNNVVRHNK